MSWRGSLGDALYWILDSTTLGLGGSSALNTSSQDYYSNPTFCTGIQVPSLCVEHGLGLPRSTSDYV
jgi:hypothetical protein